jgi:hypothetical protein
MGRLLSILDDLFGASLHGYSLVPPYVPGLPTHRVSREISLLGESRNAIANESPPNVVRRTSSNRRDARHSRLEHASPVRGPRGLAVRAPPHPSPPPSQPGTAGTHLSAQLEVAGLVERLHSLGRRGERCGQDHTTTPPSPRASSSALGSVLLPLAAALAAAWRSSSASLSSAAS